VAAIGLCQVLALWRLTAPRYVGGVAPVGAKTPRWSAPRPPRSCIVWRGRRCRNSATSC